MLGESREKSEENWYVRKKIHSEKFKSKIHKIFSFMHDFKLLVIYSNNLQ